MGYLRPRAVCRRVNWVSGSSCGAGSGHRRLDIVILLFPDGHLPSRRWRFVPWISAAGFALALPGQALNPDHGAEFTGGTNPFGVEGLPTGLLFGAGMRSYWWRC